MSSILSWKGKSVAPILILVSLVITLVLLGPSAEQTPLQNEPPLMQHGQLKGDENMNRNSTLGTSSPKSTLAPTFAGDQSFFSYERVDRSGAAIHDMLMSHALAFSKGSKYAGTCPRKATNSVPEARIKERTGLLQMLGLDFFVHSKCPKGAKMVGSFNFSSIPKLFSSEYMDYLRSTSTPPTTNVGYPRAPRITVHIRRGDVNPCVDTRLRYLPNQHYLTLIETYTNKIIQQMKQKGIEYTSGDIEVLVVSESESYESFDIFRELGFNVVLDAPVEKVWKWIAFDSDVVILSLSSFSMVPGILSLALSPSPTTVVYTPFWHAPLPQFDNVEDLFPELLESTAAELKHMYSSCTKAFA